MRGVKKNTQKIIAGFFVSIFVLQGIFGFVTSAYAQATAPTGYTDAAIKGGADVSSVKQGQGIATGDVSTGCNVFGNITACLKDFSLWILAQIRNVIILVIASPAAALFVWVVNPANVSGPTGILNFPAIYTLWQFIRDFFNLFFIFILLFSAFATIFQVDSFNIRNIFKNVLLAALLINFSFPITRFLIDLANVPMYYFINDVIGAGGGQGAVTAMNNLLGFSGLSGAALTSDFIDTFASIIFAFLFGISLAVLAVMLIVRLVALTLLLVFSPFGFASALVPGLNKYGQEWWSNFWNYALFGPAAALMLAVSLKFLEATQAANVWQSVNQVSTNASVDAAGATLITSVIFSTIPIILIWSTIGLANKFSIAGAATVVGLGYGAAHWARKKVQGAAVGTAKLGGRKIEKQLAKSKYTRFLSPTAVTTAWKARSEEQKHKDEAPVKQAAAAMQDTINRRMSKVFRSPLKYGSERGVEHTENTFAESQRQAHEAEKHITEVNDSSDHVVNESVHALNNKKLDEFNGSLLALAKSNDLNDWIQRVGKLDRYADMKDADGKKMVDTDTDGNVVVSSKNAKFLIAQTLRDSGEKDEELLAKRVMAISDRATASGNFAFGGMTKFDETLNDRHGGFRLSTVKPKQQQVINLDNSLKFENGKPVMEDVLDASGKVIMVDEQAEWAAGKIKNLESQKRQTTLHPDSMFTRSADGFGDINGEVAKAIAGTFTGADVAQVERSRDDLKEAIHQAYMNQSTEFMNLFNSNDIFKQYVQSVVKIKRGIDHKKPMENFETLHPPGSKWPPAQPTNQAAAAPSTPFPTLNP